MNKAAHGTAIGPGNYRKSFGRAFGLLLAVLLFLVGFSLFNFRRLSDANAWNAHSYQVLLETHGVLESLLNMETGVRGFLVTGDESFLEPFYSGRRDFDAHWRAARNLTLDRPDQTSRMAQLAQLERHWQDVSVLPLLVRRRHTAVPVQIIALANQNALGRKAQMDQMRAVIGTIQRVEEELQAERQDEQRSLKRWTEVTLWSGGLFSIVLTMALISLAGRNGLEIAAANQRLGEANARLEEANGRMARTNVQLEDEVQERRRAEELLRETVSDLERSNADLEQFAYVASHDLQEPLRAVGGCVQVLQRRYQGQLDERADVLVQHAVEGAQRMQNLINDLLAYSRLGTRTREFQTVNLDSVLDAALRSLRVAIAESSAEIIREPLPTINGDPAQLEQVFLNLISNAVKFHGETPPEVTIRCGEGVGARNGSWVISVSDNGTGIDPQYFDRIFIMFQRLHTRNEYPGTGIGLAVCKKVIERHGGRIWVEAKPGEGSSFYFTLPVNSARRFGEAGGEALASPAKSSI